LHFVILFFIQRLNDDEDDDDDDGNYTKHNNSRKTDLSENTNKPEPEPKIPKSTGKQTRAAR